MITFEHLRKALDILLRDLTFADNFKSFQITNKVIAANTEEKYRNELTTIPSGYIIIKQTGNALVTAGDTAWDSNFVYLKNHDSTNSATVTVIFFR